MSLLLEAMTEIDAINTMLISIGEQPVDGLGLEGIPEVSIAKNIFTQTSRQVQSKGYSFNTEENYPLQITTEGQITLPNGTLKVESADGSDVVMRGNRLYDRTNHTFTFARGMNVNIVLQLEFNDLPQSAKDYITIRAARILQARIIGAESLHQFTAKDEYDAYLQLYQDEIDMQNLNMVTNNSSLVNMLRR